MSSSQVSPKAQLLEKVASLEGAVARTATEKTWTENTVKLLYGRNAKPPISQTHADRLMAEEQWWEACRNRNYSWSGQLNTSDTSEPRHPQYFHYWFERKRLDELANPPDDEGEANPLTIDEKHDLAWQKVVAQEKGALSKTTKKELLVLHNGVKQQNVEAERLAWEYKKAVAAGKERMGRKIAEERRKSENHELKYRRLKHKLSHGDHGDWGEQVAKSDGLILENHIQALEGKYDMKDDNINEKLDENRDLKMKLSHAEGKILALELENDELREKAGKAVKVKKEEEPDSLKLENIQSVDVKKEGGSRKRRYEEVDSEHEELSSDQEFMSLDDGES
ncbi:hypothetical protein PG993_011121 [Apiospora rasikravindrae]|uniref:Uncharacterized protein n=1 Tax=Apiospora rasikravindrae TaxID=990691 RepID=A0ABR1SDC5_9PEZI